MRRCVPPLLICVLSCGQAEPPPASPPPLEPNLQEVAPAEGPPTEAPTSEEDEAAAVPASYPDVERTMGLSVSESTSTGNPNYGDLVGGIPMPDRGVGFVHNPRRPRGARFGTVELVQSLVRAAGRVHQAFPNAELWINDLSLEPGGRIRGHQSHQNGRDVDVLFYYLTEDGDPYPPVAVFVDRQGRGVDFRDLADPADDVPLRLDVPRSWSFIAAYLEDPVVRVNRVFLAEHVRMMLLDHARRTRAPEQTIQLFEAVTCQPNSPHDDHFHIRIYCSPEDLRAGCHDSHPLYPWHREFLASHRLQPQLSRRRRPRPPTTSRGAARQSAGEMDAEVHRWLDLREDWAARPPRTGRPYCR